MVRVHPLVPFLDASNNSMFACLSSRSERGQHPSRPPFFGPEATADRHPTLNRALVRLQLLPGPKLFKPAKTKQSSRVSLTDEEAGASPVAGASFLGHEEERLIRLPWKQEIAGSNPASQTIHTITGKSPVWTKPELMSPWLAYSRCSTTTEVSSMQP